MIRKGLPIQLFCAMFCLAVPFIGQDDGWRISGVSLSHTNLNEFESNVTKNELLDKWSQYGGLFDPDFENPYQGSYGYSGNVVGGGHTYLHLILNPKSAVLGIKPNYQSIQIGLGYGNNIRLSRSLFESDEKTIDTLSSDLGPIFVDSVYQNRLSVTNGYDRLSLDLQYQLSTDPQSRFNVYIAPALSFNYFTSRQLDATYTENWREEYRIKDIRFNRHQPYNREPTLREVQQVELKDDIGFSAYLPVGIRWRINKDNVYINHIYLFAEGRVGLDYRNNPTVGNNLRSNTGITFGIRFWVPSQES